MELLNANRKGTVAGVIFPLTLKPSGTYANYSRYTYDSFGNRLSEVTPTINQTMTADRNTNRVTLSGTTVTYRFSDTSYPSIQSRAGPSVPSLGQR